MDVGSIAAWVAVAVTVAGTILAVHHRAANRIAEVERGAREDNEEAEARRASAEKELIAAIEKLHDRINDVKETYVRRDDLREHLDRIERGQAQIVSAVQDIGAQVKDVQIKVARAISGAD